MAQHLTVVTVPSVTLGENNCLPLDFIHESKKQRSSLITWPSESSPISNVEEVMRQMIDYYKKNCQVPSLFQLCKDPLNQE